MDNHLRIDYDEGRSIEFMPRLNGAVMVIIHLGGSSGGKVQFNLRPPEAIKLKEWLEREKMSKESEIIGNLQGVICRLELKLSNLERDNKDSAPMHFKDKADEIIYDTGYRDGAKALADYLSDHPGKIEGNGGIDKFMFRLNSVAHEFTEDL